MCTTTSMQTARKQTNHKEDFGAEHLCDPFHTSDCQQPVANQLQNPHFSPAIGDHLFKFQYCLESQW